MASWPSNWKAKTLGAAGIEVTPKALKVMSAWQQSTPLQPWTNNPLGMPVSFGSKVAVPMTSYALFPSMSKFYMAFADFTGTRAGKDLRDEITSDDGYGPIWRTVSSLNWPGSKTETEYPAALLDLAGQSYKDSVNAVNPSARKSSGLPKANPEVRAMMTDQARSLTQAAAVFNDSATAVRYLIRRHTGNG